MLYGGQEKVLTMGKKAVPVARMPHGHAGSLHFVNNTLYTFISTGVTPLSRDSRMFRWYDYLNYSNSPDASVIPPAGGLEVETEYEIEQNARVWSCVIGSRNGTTGKVTRINLLASNTGGPSVGVSILPSDNTIGSPYTKGRRIHHRLIITPVLNPDDIAKTPYTHVWYANNIITDAVTGTQLLNEELLWGDANTAYATNALTSSYTTFYRFQIGFGGRNRYASPSSSSQTPTGNEFKGYLWGTKIYVNPLGYDPDVATRGLVTEVDPDPTNGLVYKVYNIDQVLAGVSNPDVAYSGNMAAIFGGVMNQDVFYMNE